MNTDNNTNYYLKRINKYRKRFGRLFKSSDKILPKYLDVSLAKNVKEETFQEFKVILSRLPYIGGDKNQLTFTFVSSALALAYIRVLEKKNLPPKTIGVILNKVYEDVFKSLPGIVKWWLRWYSLSPLYQNKLKAFAKELQLRQYPDNWVMEFVEGDGVNFDFGYNYIECAILKFYRKESAEQYMPYVCATDFAASNALRTGLYRTRTLAYGCETCDFRHKNNLPAIPGLPIENLPEYQNRKRDI